jgi:hypothetical protein
MLVTVVVVAPERKAPETSSVSPFVDGIVSDATAPVLVFVL